MAVDLFIINYISPIFNHMLFMSVTAAIVGIIVYIIRAVFDKKISPVWKYSMWGLLIVALILPFRPQADFSLMNNANRLKAEDYRGSELLVRQQLKSYKTDYQQGSIEEFDNEQQQGLQAKAEELHTKSLIFQVALPIIWLIGMFAALIILMASRVRLSYKIKRHTIAKNELGDILLRCMGDLKIKADIDVIIQGYIKSPALIGLIRPQILLPDYVLNMKEESIYYIVLHELSHYKRKDMLLNYILLALQAVYWFNPVIWLLFKYIREDAELLNDGAVLKAIGTEHRQGYARALVEVLLLSHNISLMPKLLCMTDGKKNVQRRISMIKLTEVFKKHKILLSVFCLAVIVLISGLFLTQGKTAGELTDTEFMVTDVVHQDARISVLYTPENSPQFKVDKRNILNKAFYGEEWEEIGELYEYPQSREQLYEYFHIIFRDEARENISKVEKVYRAGDNDDRFYLVMRQSDGNYLVANVGTERDDSKVIFCLYKVSEKTKLPPKAATNAEILELDKENNTITVKGDKETIGDNCILSVDESTKFITLDENNEIVFLTIDDFAVGDYAVVFVKDIQETYPTRARLETIQLKNKLELKYDTEALWENRTEYVGNNVKVGGILGALRYPQGITTNGFSLHTGESPYAITLNLKTDTKTRNFYSGSLNQAEFEKIAFIVFSLVENVEEMIFSIDDGVNPYDFTVYREQADRALYVNCFDKTITLKGFEEVLSDIEKQVDASYEALRNKFSDSAEITPKIAEDAPALTD